MGHSATICFGTGQKMARNRVKTRQAPFPSRVRRGDIERALLGGRVIAEALPGQFLENQRARIRSLRSLSGHAAGTRSTLRITRRSVRGGSGQTGFQASAVCRQPSIYEVGRESVQRLRDHPANSGGTTCRRQVKHRL